jgi:glutamine amidotransferase
MDDGRVGDDVVVVYYGLGNLRSVTRGLERAGAGVTITDDPGALETADGIVLPGVGAFSERMENAGPFRGTLVDAAGEGRPVFGIRLGMQMLLSGSEEADHVGQGDAEGLDIVPGRNVRFDCAAHGLERTRRSARSPARGGRRRRVRLLRPLLLRRA